MRIVLVSEVFARNMGYLENLLPKHLARRGAEVHVIASALPPDYRRDRQGETYRDFQPAASPGSVTMLEGFRLHILRHERRLGHVRLLGLGAKLRDLRPDIVQIMTPIGWIAIEAAFHRFRFGYRLFSGCHYHASVFPLAQKPLAFFDWERWRCFFERGLQGRVLSWATEKYYAISPDCAQVARRFFGVPASKIEISALGVDTEVFHPVRSPSDAMLRRDLRARLGFQKEEIVCVYSGRFTADKNPLLLARALAELAAHGDPYRGLFIGNGAQAAEIASCRGCVSIPFMPMRELGAFYRSADIGVWPTQESMSMLDALACGIPLVANATMNARERLEGCGFEYRLLDLADLMRALRRLRPAGLRAQLGAEGARRMREKYSWEAIAVRRMADYAGALAGGSQARDQAATLAPPINVGRQPSPIPNHEFLEAAGTLPKRNLSEAQ